MAILSTLCFSLFVTIITWLATYHWKKRHIYTFSSSLKGPTHIPFFGISLPLLLNPDGFLDTLQSYLANFPHICRMWFANEFLVGISSPQYADIIMNHPNALAKMDYMYKSFWRLGGRDGLVTSEGEVWRRHRKILNPAFNQKILNGFVEIFVKNCKNLTDKLDTVVGKGETDLHSILYKHNMDVICESTMDVKINEQTTDSHYHHVFERLLDIGLLRMVHILYHFDVIYQFTKVYKEDCELIKKFGDFTDKVIRNKKQKYEKSKKNKGVEDYAQIDDYTAKFRPLSDTLVEETSFTEKEMREEVMTFFLAGSDSTSSTSAFILLMLAIHQDVQQKVLDEVLAVIGPDRDIEPNDFPYLKYTDQVIKETLRIFTPVPFIFRSVKGDIQLEKNLVIPAGSSVMFGLMAIHRSAEYWPNPLNFDPDRFLPEEVAKRHPYAFIPFSGGPRNCIGFRFALMSLKTIVATLIRKYKITSSYKSVEDIKITANVILKLRNGCNVTLERR